MGIKRGPFASWDKVLFVKRRFQSKVEGKSFLLIPNMSKVFQGDVIIIYAKTSVKWAALASA